MARDDSARGLITLLASVSFVNWLDMFLLVPLGPDVAKDLHIPLPELGVVVGGYSAAGAVASLAGSLFLDSFDRKKALAVCLGGLVLGTAFCGCAVGLGTIIAARVVAGLFAGPTLSISYALIADAIPGNRRGKAFAAMTGSFALAQVLGVPASLELARVGGWRAPFFILAVAGAIIAAIVLARLPAMAAHAPTRPGLLKFWREPTMLISLAMTAALLVQTALIAPNIPSYVQFNMGLPRARLSVFYLVGGLLSLIGSRVGAIVDRFGGPVVMAVATGLATINYVVWFIAGVSWISPYVFFGAFMLAQSMRFVGHNTITSKIARPTERGRFLSMQASTQNAALSGGSFMSARLLVEGSDKRLMGMPRVAILAIVFSLCVVPIAWIVSRRTGPSGD